MPQVRVPLAPANQRCGQCKFSNHPQGADEVFCHCEHPLRQWCLPSNSVEGTSNPLLLSARAWCVLWKARNATHNT